MKLPCLFLLAFAIQVGSAVADDATPTKEPEGVKPGDQWTYDQTDEITGNLKFTYTNAVASVTDREITLRVTRRGDERVGLMVFDPNWNLIDDGVWKKRRRTGGEGIEPPLKLDKEWRISESLQNLKTGEFYAETGKAKVVSQESFTTQAGTFDTFKIVAELRETATADPAKSFQSTITTWYAPSINRWVKRITAVRSLGRLRASLSEELVDYAQAP